MAAPTTPQHKHLAAIDQDGIRASSTPPSHRKHLHISAPSPSSRHSSPGTNNTLKVKPLQYEELIPRRLTVTSPPRTRDRDRTRKRLPQYSSVDDAVNLLRNARKIVVLTGAGISTSLNIPDFRSDDGFYSKLSSKIGITTPEEFFSLDFFKHESESFWNNVKPLLPRYARTRNGGYQSVSADAADKASTCLIPRFSKTHAFLAMLDSKSKLLTNYTQNIDGLEYAAGVDAEKIVQCHGSWDTATCLTCHKTISARKYLPIVAQSGYPRCKCSPDDLEKKKLKSPRKKKRKRHVFEGDSDHDSDDGTKTPGGLYKPDITFFGEPIPDYYVPKLESDKVEADLLIILGTSLKVRPVKTMLVDFPPHIPQIWINRDRFSGTNSDMPGVKVDIELLGDCDAVVEELCRRNGFDLEAFTWKQDMHAPTTRGSKDRDGPETDSCSETKKTTSEMASIPPSTPPSDTKKPKLPIIKVEDKAMTHPSLPIITSPRSHTFTEDNLHISDIITTARQADDTQQHNRNVHTDDKIGNVANKTSKVKVDQDLDAEWRWRFTLRK